MSDETAKAQSAKPTEDTIFGKIARKEIPVDLLHDDDQVGIAGCLEQSIDIDSLFASAWLFTMSVNKHRRIFSSFPRNRSNSSRLAHRHTNRCVSLLVFDSGMTRLYLASRTSADRGHTSGEETRSDRRRVSARDQQRTRRWSKCLSPPCSCSRWSTIEMATGLRRVERF